MKNIFLTSVLIIFCLTAYSSKPHKGYMISANVEGAGNGIAVLAINVNNNPVFSDTTTMTNGRFEFHGHTPQVRSAVINIIPDNYKSAMCAFTIENSPITINGKWSDVTLRFGTIRSLNGKLKITGSKNHDFISKVNGLSNEMILRPKYKEYRELNAEMNKKWAEGKKAEVEALKSKYQELDDLFMADVIAEQNRLIANAKDVEVAGDYLFSISNSVPMIEITKIFKGYTKRVQNCEKAQAIREKIMNFKPVIVGKPAPDFTLEQRDGSKLSLSELRGKVVLVNFWTSHSEPSCALFTKIKALYSKYKPHGLEIVGINSDGERSDWVTALDKYDLPWLQVFDKSNRSIMGSIGKIYDTTDVPAFMLIDKKGILVEYKIKFDELESKIDRLLGL